MVSVLFISDYFLCDCPELYLFVNNTQQDAYHKDCFFLRYNAMNHIYCDSGIAAVTDTETQLRFRERLILKYQK
jgi:hypothetical protein